MSSHSKTKCLHSRANSPEFNAHAGELIESPVKGRRCISSIKCFHRREVKAQPRYKMQNSWLKSLLNLKRKINLHPGGRGGRRGEPEYLKECWGKNQTRNILCQVSLEEFVS